MKFRLDVQHYINDRLLEPGHIIGDETDVPMVSSNGEPILPSVNMTPLDDEAFALFQERFPGTKRPDRDPTKAIPLRGTGDQAKSPPLFQKNEAGQVIQPGGQGATQTLGDQPGSYVLGPEGEPTKELKKGLPDPGSPNHPVGQPVQGIVSGEGRVTVPPKPTTPELANHPSQAEPTQTQKDAAAATDKAKVEAAAKAESERKQREMAAKPTTFTPPEKK